MTMDNNEQEYSREYVQNGVVPQEIKGWNWGAFCFNINWGFGNKSYLPLLCLVPFFNIIWIFVCGAKGNEWAWKNNNYQSIETFKAVQETWNRAGWISFLIALAFAIMYILFFVFIGFAAFNSYNQ